ncbi:MAG: DUF4827 domain-containing protein [Muribaculaceae bacterium]|nr:DUF4827 domain-containing protein [Muribaculaceae bacterium]
MKLSRLFMLAAVAVASAVTFSSCDDGKSYADLLTEEAHAVNYFLANNRVVNEIPADSIFEYGENAPYYRIDEDSNLYMQVINPGTPDNKVSYDELIYFRYTRYNLKYYFETDELVGSGNSNNLNIQASSFRYGNTLLSSASEYGLGIQAPLEFLGVDCEVNLVVKSQLGPTSDIANVIPYMFNLRYFRQPY